MADTAQSRHRGAGGELSPERHDLKTKTEQFAKVWDVALNKHPLLCMLNRMLLRISEACLPVVDGLCWLCRCSCVDCSPSRVPYRHCRASTARRTLAPSLHTHADEDERIFWHWLLLVVFDG